MRAALASEALSKVRKLEPIAIPASPAERPAPSSTLKTSHSRPTPAPSTLAPALWPQHSGPSTLASALWAPGKLPQDLVPHPCNDIFSPARVPRRSRSSTDRAARFEREGCGFKSCRDRQNLAAACRRRLLPKAWAISRRSLPERCDGRVLRLGPNRVIRSPNRGSDRRRRCRIGP